MLPRGGAEWIELLSEYTRLIEDGRPDTVPQVSRSGLPVIRTQGQPTIIPHENWRGQFSRGTYTSGAVSDCGPGQTTDCTAIAWPGHRTNAWHQRSGSGPDIRTWFGGLVDGMRDASGQMYMRNRYYDPGTGQFTQTDPIGLGGGLNAYGFAAGDPVSYSDPYGLR